MFSSVEDMQQRLGQAGYVADTDIATTLFLAHRMRRPVFLEGAPGVGKTEVAKVLATIYGASLIRLQCYEGLDVSQALYEWNYPKQVLALQTFAAANGDPATMQHVGSVYTKDFLLERPLLAALDDKHPQPPVLLIDEIDRADDEFESFLLELLSDFQVSIPEYGSVVARERPHVVLTSNRTREVHDALKRRCLYAWIDYPSLDKELAIVRSRFPAIQRRLVESAVRWVQALRREELQKPPGIAESLDWVEALHHLQVTRVDSASARATRGVLLKHQDDLAFFAKWLEQPRGTA